MLIYADFNGQEDSSASPDEVHLDLTGFGTLASLSLHQVRLTKGQRLMLCDPAGLQVMGEMDFDPILRSERRSGWFAKFKRREVREGAPLEHDYATHLCFKCRLNLRPHLEKVGQSFNESCPQCGTPIMFPLLPPGN